MWCAPSDPLARDRVWFPGGFAADAPEAVLAAVHAGADLTVHVQSCRFLVIGSTRVDAGVGAAQARRLVGDLVRRFGDERPDVLLAAADLYRLGGLHDDAAELLLHAHRRFVEAGDVVGAARCHLVVADAGLAPWSSPELGGLDPWDLDRVRHAVDPAAVDGARQACDEAERLYRDAGSAAGAAAVAVRRAYLASCTGEDPVGAAERACAAATGEFVPLACTHLLVALVDAGRAGELRVRFPGDVAGWATGADGSRSYARGLATVLRGCARDRLRRGHPERARLLLTAAVETMTSLDEPDGPGGCLEDVAALYATLRSRGPAIATLRRAFDHAATGTPVERAQAVAVLLALSLEYQNERDPDGMAWCRDRAREMVEIVEAPGPGQEPDGDLFTVARERFDALPETGRGRVRPDGTPAGPEFAARTADAVMASLRESIAAADVLVPLARGLRDRREGLDARAADSFRTALAAAEELGGRGTSLRAMVLVADRRRAEAAALVRALPDDFPPDLRRALLATARDHVAAAAVPVPEPDPDTEPASTRWRGPITAAEIALRTGDPGTARRLAGTARAAFESWFAVLERDPFRVAVTDDVDACWLYLTAAEAALRDGDPVRALQLGDRLRALPMARLLADPNPSDEQLAWQRATATWSAAYDLLAATGSVTGLPPDDPAADLPGPGGAASFLDRAQVELEAAESRVARGPAPLPDPPDVGALRAGLPPGALLLQYLLVGDRLLIGVLDADVVDGAVLEVDADVLAGHVRRVHATCRHEHRPGDAEQARHELGRALLGPVAEHLRRHERVVVVPSGPLWLLPFATLPFDDGLLGDRHVLSFLPSSAALPALPAARPGTTVVVGDPGFDDLTRLPGTRVEALAVARHHGVDAVLGDAATRRAVLDRLAGAQVVHLATHGLVSATAPTASSLALAGTDRLSVADLAGVRFRSDLVVLSACDTGRGDITLGGDVVGLGRQLLAAGAGAVVVSLWPVDDRVACVVMDELHARLAAGDGPAVALARAQAAVRARAPAERVRRYERIAADVGADPGPGESRARAARPSGPASQGRGMLRDARDWAAFVLLGRP